MLTARYRQKNTDRIRYVIGLDEFLAELESITGLTVVQDAGIVVDDVAALPPDARAFQFFVSGGVAGTVYDFSIIAATSDGQRWTSNMQAIIEETVAA